MEKINKILFLLSKIVAIIHYLASLKKIILLKFVKFYYKH